MSGLVASVLVVLGALLAACGSSRGQEMSPRTFSQSKEKTLYLKIGGVEALRILVDEWILEVSSDERIRDFFVHADIVHLKLRLVERICVQVEGPCLYKGREMYEVHSELKIEELHLRAFIQALEPAMQRANIVGDAADELRAAIRGLGAEIAIALRR